MNDGAGEAMVPVVAAVEAALDEAACRELQRAVELLENPGFLVEVANHLGVPIERLMARLPGGASKIVARATDRGLRRAVDLAVRTMDLSELRRARTGRHRLALSGAVGGAGGLAALAVELPLTTTLILRSIADIGREEGENLSLLESRLACLSVFALGGRTKSDDAAENAYFAIRAALAEGIRRVVETGGTRGAARYVVNLVSKIAARFEIVVTEKAVAQAAPLLGAVGGATINLLFTSHFQKVARGHFTVRRLERTWGAEAVRAAYERLVCGAGCP